MFTGPYRIAPGPDDLLPAGDAPRITLERNPSWDAAEDFRPAFFDRIVLDQRAPGPAALARRVLDGSAAVTVSEPAGADLVSALRTRPAQVALSPAGEITFIALNTRLAPFDNADVRRAVSAALDREALREALGGAVVGSVATHWIPPEIPGFAEAGGQTRAPVWTSSPSPEGTSRLHAAICAKPAIRWVGSRVSRCSGSSPVARRPGRRLPPRRRKR